MLEDSINQITGVAIRYLFLLGLFALAIAVFKSFVLPKLKGRAGEVSVNFLAKRFLDRNVYHLISDVTLPAGSGTTQIDHVIVSRYGIFVIETKNYKGWIYGGENDAKWTQVIYKRKERFQNPLRQNYKHTKTLSDLTGIPHDYFKSIVVFVGDSTFKTDMPDHVLPIGRFVRYIKSHQKEIIKDEQVPQVAEVIRDRADTVTADEKRHHVRNLRARKAVKS